MQVTAMDRWKRKKTEHKWEAENMTSVNSKQQGTTKAKGMTKLRRTNQIQNEKGQKR